MITLKQSFLITLIAFIGLIPTTAQAQFDEEVPLNVEWKEIRTDYFVIVYATQINRGEANEPVVCPHCGIIEAEKYAAIVDILYTELAIIFELELDTPVNLHLYPTEESYFVVNPLAEYLTGVIAHALNSRQEIAVAVPRTEQLNEAELLNNMRHEFTHLFASKLSDGNLKAGFQEGIAQYLEKPTEKAAYDPALLKLAFEQGRLLSWDEIDQAREIYTDPQVAYPQTLSIVSFLVDRYGFPKFLEFVKATATESGYRSALSVTYEKSAETLEAEWEAYLPSYFENRWKINALYNYDLSRVTDLVNRGAFSDAETEINEIVTLLETTNQREIVAEAQALLNRAELGKEAGLLADEARTALESGAYPLAIEKGEAAIQIYDASGYRDRIPEIQVYIQRAEIGQQSLNQLEQGAVLLDQFRFFEAERRIQEATFNLQILNNQSATQRGVELLQLSTERQSLVGYILLAIAGALALANAVHRLINRWSAHPLEVEFQ